MKRLIILLVACLILTAAAPAESPVAYTLRKNKEAPYESVQTWDSPRFPEESEFLYADFIDKGMADCIFLRCGSESLLVDGGMFTLIEQQEAFFDFLNVSGFTYMLNTHCHDDHITGLYRLIQRGYGVGTYMAPYADDYRWSESQIKMRKLLTVKGIPYRKISNGDKFSLGNADITVFRDERPLSDKNMHSAILKVVYGSRSLLLMADAGIEAQKYLLDLYGDAMQADVLKYPHHGMPAMNPEYIDMVKPFLAIITNSRSAAKSAEHQLASRRIPRYYTMNGIVRLQTDGIIWHAEQMMPGWPKIAE